MAMIADANYVLHAIRLSALRTTDDQVTPRVITLDPTFGLNPYIAAMGLDDIDRWPEIKRALDSPEPERPPLSSSADDSGADASLPDWQTGGRGGATGLRYTQTIMGPGRTGGAGMRVSGRRVEDGAGISARRALRPSAQRSQSSSTDVRPPVPPRSRDRPPPDVFTDKPAGKRPRSGSEPVPKGVSEGGSVSGTDHFPSSVPSEISADLEDDGLREAGEYDGASDAVKPSFLGGTLGYEPETSSMGVAASALPSDLAMTAVDTDGLTGEALDEGSDVDEDEIMEEEDLPVVAPPVAPPALARRPSHIRDHHQQHGHFRVSIIHEEERRSSTDTNAEEKLEFKRIAPAAVAQPAGATSSALTAALNQHVPHLVSTGGGAAPPEAGSATGGNPFASLYASVAAPATVPSILLEVFFPTSDDPSDPVHIKVRKDATVEEATGHSLWKYWDEGRSPSLDASGDADALTTVGWGLRIVEDDGEVDEDFPPLDRESQVAKFSYGQFGVVPATETQKKQNAAMAPLIQRRPSRIIVDHAGPRQPIPRQSSGRGAAQPAGSMEDHHLISPSPALGTTSKSSGLGSATSKPVLLRVHVSAPDVNFTTTISVPSDMYFADLTEVLVSKKQLQNPPSEWVLCLADLTLALPLDRTVASLEGKTDLTLVRRQWAAEQGLRANDRRGGDPNASIFKRASEPVPLSRLGGDFTQTYKKYTVQRKTPIRHERQLAIDGDYIHILPSENRAFFDSVKTTSFHISLVASCKLSGRAGGFKIYVWRDGNRKRYEFEAENGRQAQEIIASIKQLMKMYQTERQSVNLAQQRPVPATRR